MGVNESGRKGAPGSRHSRSKGSEVGAVRCVEATRSDSAFRSMKWEAWIIGHVGAFHLSRGQTTTRLRSHVRVVKSHPEGDQEL